jgi:hypothetical protein
VADDPLSKLEALARTAASQPVAPEVDRDGRFRVMAALASRHVASASVPRPLIALAFAATAALAALFVILPRRPLTYRIEGSSALVSPYISAPPESSIDVRFSDGSAVRAEAGTRLRVDETRSDGARVLVEKGAATAEVAHRPRRSWEFVAGPFEIRVMGTRFTLAWDPAMEVVDLALYEGSVEVRGPLLDQAVLLKPGQHLHAVLPDRSLSLFEAGASTAFPEAVPMQATPSALPKASAPPDSPALAGGSASLSSGPPKTPGRRDSWPELVARGDFNAVVASATTRGIDSCLTGCTGTELRALADAARYTGRAGLAEQCLRASRTRFVGTSQSAVAAFLLGRQSEQQGRPSEAQGWYDTYLSEAGDGEYAAEALAGKMRTVAKTSGAASAKALAAEYLRRYPNGVHVKAARKIAGLE